MYMFGEHMSFQRKNVSRVPEKKGVLVGEGKKSLGVPGWVLVSELQPSAWLDEWTFLGPLAQRDGEEGGPCSKRQGRRGDLRAPARPFQGGLMHQTSIFRTIELVIFFLLN